VIPEKQLLLVLVLEILLMLYVDKALMMKEVLSYKEIYLDI
jgi:hypothetical protein